MPSDKASALAHKLFDTYSYKTLQEQIYFGYEEAAADIDAFAAQAVQEAVAPYQRVLEEALELVVKAEKHMRGLSRSTYSTFCDADKLYAKQTADELLDAITKLKGANNG